jgi:hypothetical protein
MLFLLNPAEMTEEVILDPPKVGIKLKAENVDIAYPPLFQSGGSYDLKLNAACDDNPLHDGEAPAAAAALLLFGAMWAVMNGVWCLLPDITVHAAA